MLDFWKCFKTGEIEISTRRENGFWIGDDEEIVGVHERVGDSMPWLPATDLAVFVPPLRLKVTGPSEYCFALPFSPAGLLRR